MEWNILFQIKNTDNDSFNLGRGNIIYSNVKGDVGNIATFRINGGSNVIVKRLGSDVKLTGAGIASV
ncbi:hypothetical protein ACFP3I_03670 [Chryseobacterium arachidis]|uniref:hypothetical protein n=1 Tax=Chryseobacterium arachidis TaxID=1416778 RepID=UPI00361FAE7E